MKNNLVQVFRKNNVLNFVAVLLMFLSACKTKDQAVPDVGSLSIYNISPTFSTYDASINNRILNGAALPFGGGTKYIQLPTDNYTVKFKTSGTSDQILTQTGVSIGANTFNSLYLLGSQGNFEALYVPDNFENTTFAKTYVRFINLSPDAPALDLFIKDAATPLTANKKYKAHGDFIALEPGINVLEIKETSSGNVKSTLESTNFGAGKFYTVISRGKLNPSGTLEHSFDGQIILHQ